MINFYGQTDIGVVRSINQDAFACGRISDDTLYIIVCDGMGGHSAGDIASQTAVGVIENAIKKSYGDNMSQNSIRDLLISAIKTANAVVFDKAKNNVEYSGMGTTVVASIIRGNTAYICHIGDSRAYHISPFEATQLTKDHSVVQRLVDEGSLTDSEAQNHPKKNMLTRALGVEFYVETDYLETTFSDKDILLICTDGLTNYISAKELYEISQNQEEKINLPHELIELAKMRGGSDNITVAVAYR